MNTIVFVLAAILLSIERLTYVWAWRRSEQFIAVCRRIGSGIDPIDALEGLFRLFKVLQLAVFVGWSMWWDGGGLTVRKNGALAPLDAPPGSVIVSLQPAPQCLRTFEHGRGDDLARR